jgi:hypothetical protein
VRWERAEGEYGVRAFGEVAFLAQGRRAAEYPAAEPGEEAVVYRAEDGDDYETEEGGRWGPEGCDWVGWVEELPCLSGNSFGDVVDKSLACEGVEDGRETQIQREGPWEGGATEG